MNKVRAFDIKKFTSTELKKIQHQIKDELSLRKKERIVNYMKSFGIGIIENSESKGLFELLSCYGVKPPIDEREIKILRLRYGRNKHTLEETGKRFNLSRERIRQIEEMAMLKLSDYEKSPLYQNNLRAEVLG